MKPKTKLQVEVWNLHKTLSNPIEQEPFVISNHVFYYTTHYKNLVCMECNHQWKPTQVQHKEVIGVQCPECKKKLIKINTQNGGIAVRIITYSIAQVVERFQVIRYFSCWKHMSKNKSPRYSFHALFEEWKDWDKNKIVIVGRTQSWSGDGFSHSDYEIRGYGQPHWNSDPYVGFASDINYPGAEFLPRFEKYGLNKYKHNCDFRFLISKLEHSPKVETLLKARQKELLTFAVHHDSRYSTYWAQIKIVIRNKYKIKDAGIWYDYLDLLRYFNKDIHNPKFICPKALKKEHDRLMKKKRIILDREAREREQQAIIRRQQKLENAAAEFEERLKKFFDLEFTGGELTIQPLKSIDEFKEEGDELKHCVFTNEYYLKENSLILSARVSGVRTETIELNLKTFKIMQSRGLKNNFTQYHNQIIELVNKNISKISKIVKKQKRFKELDSNLNQLEKVA